MATSDSKTYKVLVIGDASTGKTSLTHRYLTGIFVDSVRLTIGVDFFSKRIKRNNERIKLQIWDFGGEGGSQGLLCGRFCGMFPVDGSPIQLGP